MHRRLLTFLASVLFSYSFATHARVSSFAVIGDAGQNLAATAQTRTSIRNSGVHKLILPGDNVYKPHTSYDEVWQSWRRLGFTFDLVALGNHNLGYDQEIRYFGMSGEYFSQVLGGARFLVLNSDNEATAAAQARWLQDQFTTVRESLVFVVFHHPPSTISRRHTWEEKKAFFEAVRPVLIRNKARIAALLVGHDHVASLLTWSGIPMVVSGAAAEFFPPFDVWTHEDGIEVRTQWAYPQAPHWARLDIDAGKGEAWIHFIDSTTSRKNCSARLAPSLLLRPNCSGATARVNRDSTLVLKDI